MYLLRAFAATLAGAAILIQSTTAHSTPRNPLSYITNLDNAVIHTPSHRVNALSSFELSFELHDRTQRIRLVLTPNHDVISENAVVQYMGADGRVYATKPINRLDHRVFKGDAFTKVEGHSEWMHTGWARIAIHQDGQSPVFEGAFSVNGNQHHIQTSTKYSQTRLEDDPEIELSSDTYMVVWRESDIISAESGPGELKRSLAEQASCTSDTLLFNRNDDHPVYRDLGARAQPDDESTWSVNPRSLFGRQIDGTTGGNGAGVNLTSTIGNPAGCPSTRRVALMGVATDCEYMKKIASTQSTQNTTSDVTSHIIQQVNTASQLYENTFNISLAIQNLTLNTVDCPASAAPQAPWNVACGGGVTITDRLNLFSKWRGQFADTNAFWTLLSACPTDSAVGLAWLGQICAQGAQSSQANGQNETIAGANVVVWTPTEWQVMAHEIGHTFGAVHDCTAQTCSDNTVAQQQCCPLSTGSCDAQGKFMMNPSTGSGITQFSPCSIGNICSAIGRNAVKTSCLVSNRDVTTITGSQCGNGIVETGEDCDCGGPNGCGNNPCCNPTTCKFTTNSVCDFSNEECCTKQCQFASSGTVCRASTGVCDPQETCTGNQPNCPADVKSPDGTTCGASGANLYCASGQCTSRDQQCKTLMGSFLTGNDTYACQSQGCQLLCSSPAFTNQCRGLNQNFLDGTSCQGGGRCSNGVCQGSTVGGEISSWFNDNKTIIIPVASVVGGLIVLAIVWCIISSCIRRHQTKRQPKPGPMPGPMSGPPGPMPQHIPPGWNGYNQPPGYNQPHGAFQPPARTFSARYA